jgi:pyrroline-5-carboxylate reductase
MRPQFEIGVVGAGNAAEGIVHGIVRNTLLFSDRIIASDPVEARRKLFETRFNVAVTDDNRQLVENSDIVILAVKPQQYLEVCGGFAPLIRPDHLIVSIMAGVATRSVEAQFPHLQARVVRAMPNLPIHVGAGMAGVCKGRYAQDVDLLRAQRIFEAGGRCIVIEDESRMDAVTAVSGSGPAYFYFFVEALTAAAERIGLSPQQASILAKQTCLGAARMLLESGEPPSVLRQKVTSPGGTTQAALTYLAENRVREHIEEAIVAAWRRSQELGR